MPKHQAITASPLQRAIDAFLLDREAARCSPATLLRYRRYLAPLGLSRDSEHSTFATLPRPYCQPRCRGQGRVKRNDCESQASAVQAIGAGWAAASGTTKPERVLESVREFGPQSAQWARATQGTTCKRRRPSVLCLGDEVPVRARVASLRAQPLSTGTCLDGVAPYHANSAHRAPPC